MITDSWMVAVFDSLRSVWMGLLDVLGNILGAAVLIIVGLILASFLKLIAEKIVTGLKIDALLEHVKFDDHLHRAGMKLDSAMFFGKIVYWFVVVVFLIAASEILRFYTLSNFLREVALYIPNVIVAALIMLAAVVLGNAVRHLVRGSVKSARLHGSNFLGSLVWWAIVVFGFLAALTQLGIAVELINALITGFVAMLALAGGIAFGLGGKDYAAHLLSKFRERVE